jgi:hypothetical protein
MTQHAELIARLEAAEGVTHSLEVEFVTHLYENQEAFKGLVSYAPELWLERNGSPLASLDAALALAERARPEWNISVFRVGGVWRAWVSRHASRGEDFGGKSPQAAPALCIAILRALEAKA